MTRIDSSKVVVLTGAASGIGRALALELAGHGARLAVSDVDAAGLQETADLVREVTGQEVRVDKLDVRDRTALRRRLAVVGVPKSWAARAFRRAWRWRPIWGASS